MSRATVRQWFIVWGIALAATPGCSHAAKNTPVQLLTQIPDAPLAPIRMIGQEYFCPPAVDNAGSVFILWRAISGAEGMELIETVFMQKVDADGQSPFGGTPKVVAQCMFSAVDRSGVQAAEQRGTISDNQGGAYHLWGAFVVRAGPNGERVWPAGKMLKGHEEELWRLPSAARFTENRAAYLTSDVFLAPDGRGNAFVFFYDDNKSAYHVQKVDPNGGKLLGANGLALMPTSNARAVPDGKGGFVLMSAVGEYETQCRAVFYNGAGVKTSESKIIDVDIQDQTRCRVAADGNGGIFLLYKYSIFNDDGAATHRILKLMNVNAAAKVTFDIGLTNGSTDANELCLRSNEPGVAIASWTTAGAVEDIDTQDPTSDLNIARVDAKGGLPWGGYVTIALPGVVGIHRMENVYHHEDLLSKGEATYVFYESIVPKEGSETGITTSVFLQKISSSAQFGYPGAGKDLGAGYTPQLFLVKGHPAAVYWKAVFFSEVNGDISVPCFMYLE